MPTVGVIGAGLIGRSWTIVFARAGWQVRLTDSSAAVRATAPALLAGALSDLAGHGLVADPKATLDRVQLVATLEDAADGADFVQECGPELIESKQALFSALDQVAPGQTVLASSSSALVASLYTETLDGRARCLVAHPVNPPHLVPIVELCGSPWTSEKTLARAREVYEQVGQVPITVLKEVDGFIVNRLQGALLAEAFRLVGHGFVSPQDLDKTLKDGLGLRWSFMGPFETIELNAPGGIADYCARYAGSYQRLQADPAGPEVYEKDNIDRILAAWGKALEPDRHAAKTRWRDERLAALVAHKRTQRGFE
jgi:L-gulonate 3-dehydrogenase